MQARTTKNVVSQRSKGQPPRKNMVVNK